MLAKACAVFLFAAAAALAQPVVNANGMVNAASAIQAGLPNGDVAQGSIFSIYGSNLGLASGLSASTWPLPTTQGLGGVTVQVKDSAGVSHYAVLLFVYAGQINAVLPSATALGQASLTVTYNGQSSAPQTFNVVKSSVGLFTRNSAGVGPGAVVQYHGGGYSFNDITASAIPGDVAVLWGTGLGPVTTDETQPPAQVNLGAIAEVWVGGQPVPSASVQYEGRSSSAGEDQINFVIPNIPGCYVPVFVKIGNLVSNTVSMSIGGANGGMCSDPLSFSGQDAAYIEANGLKQGLVRLSRTTTKIPMLGDSTTDSASGSFFSDTFTQLAESWGQLGVSVYGACTVVSFSGSQAALPGLSTSTFLDAGNLSLVGPDGATKQIPSTSKGQYFAQLGKNISLPGLPSPPLYLNPGNYALTATGGADVGAFTASLTLPQQPFTWTNVDAITQVSRANGVTVNWTGGGNYVLIEGYSVIAAPQSAGAMFSCVEQASTGAFTVPAVVLLALPPSAPANGAPLGGLMLTSQQALAGFNSINLRGLDVGGFSASFTISKSLGYN